MMASSMVKLISKNLLNADRHYSPLVTPVRYTAIKRLRPLKPGNTKYCNLISSSRESLAARGFLRSYKPYTPPKNVTERVLKLCNNVLGTFDKDLPLPKEKKFVLLKTCFEELKHSVPNSQLHKIVSVGDVIEFYETPVSTTCPFDEMKNKQLPPNLHILYDYHRYSPENDVLPGEGVVFPRSSTIVTGLKYKDKYRGHKTRSPYPDTEVHTLEEYVS